MRPALLYSAEGVDLEIVRLVGHDGTTALYLAESTDLASSVCLLIYADDATWVIGCGRSGLGLGGANGSYRVLSDGALSEGRKAISANVFK